MDIKITTTGLTRWLDATTSVGQKVCFSASNVRNLTVKSKRDNETARQAFLAYVLRECGTDKENLPEVVRNAMKLNNRGYTKHDWDVGKGRPLTARRIRAVLLAIETHRQSTLNNMDLSADKNVENTVRNHFFRPSVRDGGTDMILNSMRLMLDKIRQIVPNANTNVNGRTEIVDKSGTPVMKMVNALSDKVTDALETNGDNNLKALQKAASDIRQKVQLYLTQEGAYEQRYYGHVLTEQMRQALRAVKGACDSIMKDYLPPLSHGDVKFGDLVCTANSTDGDKIGNLSLAKRKLLEVCKAYTKTSAKCSDDIWSKPLGFILKQTLVRDYLPVFESKRGEKSDDDTGVLKIDEEIQALENRVADVEKVVDNVLKSVVKQVAAQYDNASDEVVEDLLKELDAPLSNEDVRKLSTSYGENPGLIVGLGGRVRKIDKLIIDRVYAQLQLPSLFG